MPAPYSGKFGVIDGQTTVRDWNATFNQALTEYINSATKGGRARRAGIRAWTGAFTQDLSVPTALAGSNIAAFVGYTAPNDNVSGDGLRVSGSVYVASNEITWNWAGGEVIACTTAFQGHLDPTLADGAEPADNVFPDLNEVCGTKIEYSTDGVAWNDLENLTTATLTLTNDLQTYVNSTTNCATGIRPGNQDWTLTIAQEDNAQTLTPGAAYQLRLYDTATTFYLLKWARMGDYSDLTVNTNTGEIISQSLSLAMDGYGDPADATGGRVTLPDLSDWWSAA